MAPSPPWQAELWTISPGAAPAGQVHTFTISCTNVNGTSTTTLKLTVGGSAPGVAATNYGTDSVCAPGDQSRE